MKHKQRTTQRKKQSEPEAPSSLTRGALRDDLCQFSFSDGRTCRMPRSPKHQNLCVFHARAEHELLAADEAAKRLVSRSGEFKTASDINRVLGRLFSLMAQNRIPRGEAVSLAYVAQLLLQSIPHVRDEILDSVGERTWRATVQRALGPAPQRLPALPAAQPASQNVDESEPSDDEEASA
jgi:hypothetical protein